ncbi:MAG: cyanophycinase [Candidatus Thermoplasmatota archaeon]|nr:cyanophycinase [Candidatus Thermoplasmatota archaeon]
MVKGTIIAIGGNLDLFPEEPIIKEIYRQASLRSQRPKIVIVPSASEEPQTTGKKYEYVFKAMGADAVIAHPSSRQEANCPDILRKIENMDAVFFTGGIQLRLTAFLGGTEFLHSIREQYENGAVLAGTSAGAAAMPTTMIAYGDSDQALKKGKVELAPGLAFLSGLIFDTHFITRGRLPRLLHVTAENPSLYGVGLGEDTSIVLNPETQMFQVLGTGSVIVVDAHNMVATNIPDINHGVPIIAEGLTVHVMANKCMYDIKNRKAMYDIPKNEYLIKDGDNGDWHLNKHL